MAANYNNAAWFYDGLSRLVYGSALVNAQVYLLQFVPPNTNVLIVGGGTGWILNEITKIHATGLRITYAEVAANMVARAKKRNTGKNQVVFINDAIETIALPANFDVVITPFLFDNFTSQTTQKVFNHINAALAVNGIWLNASFRLTGKWWQMVLLKTMFVFFKILCRIEASRLPDIEKPFAANSYDVIAQQTFFGDFIVSKSYKKRAEKHKKSLKSSHLEA